MTLRQDIAAAMHWAGNLLDDSVASAPRAAGPSWAEQGTAALAGAQRERAAVVACLRRMEGAVARSQYTGPPAPLSYGVAVAMRHVADAIERGEHVVKP